MRRGRVGPRTQRSTSIQLSEYHGQHPRKAPFVRRDRPTTRFDLLAGNQKARRCTTRQTAHGAYPVNEIALAGALAFQAQQRTKGMRKKEGKMGGIGPYPSRLNAGLVARFASHFELHRPPLFLFPDYFFRFFFASFSFPSFFCDCFFPYLPVFRDPDFPSLLPFAKVVVR